VAARGGRKEIVEFLIKEGGADVEAVKMVSCLIQSIDHKSYLVQHERGTDHDVSV